MALTWAQKRKTMYISGIIIFFLLIALIIYFVFFYNKPTCFDGKQNGDEVGVDCGGNCERICDEQTRQLTVVWAEALSVAETRYNVVAYIENANVDYEVRNIDYEFTFYDATGREIGKRAGNTFVPRNMRIAIFEEGVDEGIPIVRTEFTFTSKPEWYIDTTPDPQFRIEDKEISREETTPRVEGVIINMSSKTLRDIDAVSIIYDDFGTPIAASRSIVERLEAGESRRVIYTWPEPYAVGEKTCQVPVDAVLVVDRSGSMNDDQLDPPEPLTSVINAARLFVDRMSDNDKVGVVSFANTATNDQVTTFNHSDAKSKLSLIEILGGEIQNTNIRDGIRVATEELNGGRATSTARHAIILLTDGVATRPLPSGSNIENTEYAEDVALQESANVKKLGYQLYTIGLGSQVNPDFLRQISTTPDHFFEAPTSDSLSDVYTEIASSICKLGPKVIEIIPRLPAEEY